MSEQEKIQNEVEKKWEENNFKGTACLATGSGKSKIFINILNKTKESWLLVVPTVKLRDRNWKDEFKKWKSTRIYNKYVKTCCYASLLKEDLTKYKGICFDECHNITTNNIQNLSSNITNLKILCLTATLPRDFEKQYILFNILKSKLIYNLSLTKAIELNIVAPLKIYVHKLNLNTEKNIEIKYKDKNTKQEKVFYQSEEKYYEYINKKINDKIKLRKQPTQFDYLNRTRFVYDSKTKTNYAKNLLLSLPKDKRILIFSQSINQIEEIISTTYHSKTDDKYYDLFLKQKINRLGVVSALNEGENIPNLDIGIIIQVNSNPTDMLQRFGRIIRKRDNHEAVIHIIMLKNTVDEIWINNLLSDYKDITTEINI